MGMSDCEKCWDTPCACGYEYRNYKECSAVKLAVSATGRKNKWRSVVILLKAVIKVLTK